MSPLTKLFVVLLVVLSMLLSAATVVFVNTVTDYKASLEKANQQNASQLAQAESRQAAAEAARLQAMESEKNAQNTINQMRQAANQTQQLIADRDAQLGDLRSKMAMLTADIARMTEALKASEDNKGKLQEQVAQLRTSNDQLLRQTGELNLTVSDLSNRLAVTERERQFLAEQLAEAKSQADQLSAAIRDAGLSPAQLAQSAGLRGGAPAINGVIRDTRTIAGIPYATISVGANDSVQRGMEFKVLSRDTGEFLGLLVVDSVEQNEATGRLAGPRVEQIRPGNEVRTQL